MNADKHLAAVKHAVKQLVEEAVTRRFIHQDSANITALCVELDKAITFGLQTKYKRRWSTASSADVLHHLGRLYPPAAELSKKCQEIISYVGTPSGGYFFNSRSSFRAQNGGDHGGGYRQKLLNSYSNFLQHQGHERFLWIRVSLIEKTLYLIAEALVKHSRHLYESDSLMSHPVNGPIVASLLAGPCVLEYSRMKTPDRVFADPGAEELVLQDRITGNAERTSGISQHSLEKCLSGAPSPTAGRRDPEHSESQEYISALLQNAHAALLYGKNNVLVEASPGNHVPGYLSLHQSGNSLILKWTPNELVTGKNAAGSGASTPNTAAAAPTQSTPNSLTVNMTDVVCIHCHPFSSSSSTLEEADAQRIQFVLQDGTSLPPIGIQHGSPLFSFLATLETALLPSVRLKPPLWGQHNDEGGIFAPPWPVTKSQSSPAFSVPPFSPNQEGMGKKSAGSLQQPRKIEMSNLANSLGGARQYSVRQRLERGCIFHLIRTGAESPGNRTGDSPSLFDRSSSPLSYRDDAPSFGGRLGIATKEIHRPSPLPPPPETNERTPSGQRRSINDMSRRAMERMEERIKSRAFYGWLSYCRDMRIVRNHLAKLLSPVSDSQTILVNSAAAEQWGGGLTTSLWAELMSNAGVIGNPAVVMKYILFGGICDDKQHSLRKQVWPYLLGLYEVDSTPTQRTLSLGKLQDHYETILKTCITVENAIKESKADELEKCEQMFADLGSRDEQIQAMWEYHETVRRRRRQDVIIPAVSNRGQGRDGNESDHSDSSDNSPSHSPVASPVATKSIKPSAAAVPGNMAVLALDNESDSCCSCKKEPVEGSADDTQTESPTVITHRVCPVCGKPQRQKRQSQQADMPLNGTADEGKHSSSASGTDSPDSRRNGRLSTDLNFTDEEIEYWARELHKIDKDVVRCDRSYPYFVPANLAKLRSVVATYVWEHKTVGYTQGMVDLCAPLMVVFDDEVIAYGCFCKLMDVMEDNFPHGKAMDTHFFNMRLLLEVYDRELFEVMKVNGDSTHLFFAYRWYLLDLKRELVYEDIFRCWEAIWAARRCCTSNYTLFLCTGLVLNYRDIILNNNMGFTEIIKFFNDMAEKHCLDDVMSVGRDIVEYLQQRLMSA